MEEALLNTMGILLNEVVQSKLHLTSLLEAIKEHDPELYKLAEAKAQANKGQSEDKFTELRDLLKKKFGIG